MRDAIALPVSTILALRSRFIDRIQLINCSLIINLFSRIRRNTKGQPQPLPVGKHEMWPSGEFRSIPSQCYRVLIKNHHLQSSFQSLIAGQFDDLTQNGENHVINSERNRCRVIEQTNNSFSNFYTYFVVDSNGAIDSVTVHWLSLQNSRRVVAINAVILCMFCVQHLSSSISPNEWCNHLSNKCSCNRNVLARYIAHRPIGSLFNLLSNGCLYRSVLRKVTVNVHKFDCDANPNMTFSLRRCFGWC